MKNNPYPGRFISLDGIDGAGKSTQISFIKKYFLKKKYHVFSGHEPTKGKFGNLIHDILSAKAKMPKNQMEFQKLYIRDRKEHLSLDVIPALKKEKSVYVADRYFLSTLAYGMAGGLNFKDLILTHEKILKHNFIVPDLMFILNVDIELAMERLQKLKGESMDLFEKKKIFLKKTEDYFLFFKEKFDNIHIVDGNRQIKEVSQDIKNILDKYNF